MWAQACLYESDRIPFRAAKIAMVLQLILSVGADNLTSDLCM